MTRRSSDVITRHLLRELAPRVLGAVSRRCGDFADAEDVVQYALIAPSEQWPVAGLPNNPSGWLFQVARLLGAVVPNDGNVAGEGVHWSLPATGGDRRAARRGAIALLVINMCSKQVPTCKTDP